MDAERINELEQLADRVYALLRDAHNRAESSADLKDKICKQAERANALSKAEELKEMGNDLT